MDAATAALVGSGITGAVSLMVGLGTAWVTGSRAEERQRIELQAERRREQREAAADLIVAGRRWGTSMKRIVTAIHAFDDPVTTMQEQSWMAETAVDDQAFRRSLTVARLQVDHDPVLAALDGASTDLAAVDISHLVQAKFSGQPTTVYYELAVGQLDLVLRHVDEVEVLARTWLLPARSGDRASVGRPRRPEDFVLEHNARFRRKRGD